MIYGKMQPSESGPNRKYYYLTREGKEALDLIAADWEKISKPVGVLMKWRGDNECN